MATYKIVNAEQLDADMTLVADAIRNRAGTTGRLVWPTDYVEEIESIPSSGGGSTVPVYGGPYEVTPSAAAQTLSTAGKQMSRNVGIKAIPYREETNETGGTTVYIACSGTSSGEDDTTAALGLAVLGKMKLAGRTPTEGDDMTAELGRAVIGKMKLS